MPQSKNEIIFDAIFQQVSKHVLELFTSSIVAFTKAGPRIDMDAAAEYVGNIIDEINNKSDDDLSHEDFLKLSVCNLVLSFIYKFEEDTFQDGDEVLENEN